MIVSDLDSYEIALIIWSFLFILVGFQGLVSIYLEGEAEEEGVRTAHVASWWIVAIMGTLTLLDIGAAWLFVRELFAGAAPSTLGQLAALMAFLLAALVGLYRRYFMDDVVIAQERDDDVPW